MAEDICVLRRKAQIHAEVAASLFYRNAMEAGRERNAIADDLVCARSRTSGAVLAVRGELGEIRLATSAPCQQRDEALATLRSKVSKRTSSVRRVNYQRLKEEYGVPEKLRCDRKKRLTLEQELAWREEVYSRLRNAHRDSRDHLSRISVPMEV